MNDEQLIVSLRAWADCDDVTIFGKREPDPTSLKRIAADRIEALTAQLAEARESERADVVAWLRGGFCQKRKHPEDQAYARFIAAAIEAGEHD